MKPLKSSNKIVSVSQSSNSSKVPESWVGSFYFPEPCVAWHCTKIEAIRTVSFYIFLHHANSYSKDDEIISATAMM